MEEWIFVVGEQIPTEHRPATIQPGSSALVSALAYKKWLLKQTIALIKREKVVRRKTNKDRFKVQERDTLSKKQGRK